jgi:hypothetical protein
MIKDEEGNIITCCKCNVILEKKSHGYIISMDLSGDLCKECYKEVY